MGTSNTDLKASKDREMASKTSTRQGCEAREEAAYVNVSVVWFSSADKLADALGGEDVDPAVVDRNNK